MNEMPHAGAAAIAVNRFGLGARADEPLPADPRGWLLSQFAAYQALPPAWADQPNSAALAAGLVAQQREIRNSDQDAKQMARKELGRETRDTYRAAVNARVSSALTTPTPFVERLVHFWANHFALSSEKLPVATLAGAFEVEAIRPHVLGRFEDMLLAVETHPAMLVYLDQARSVGPDSMAAMRAARRDPDHPHGLNENLAREIMELHTLGARSGYTQTDVTEFARAMTGWPQAARAALCFARNCTSRAVASFWAGVTTSRGRSRRPRCWQILRRRPPPPITWPRNWRATLPAIRLRPNWSSDWPPCIAARAATCPACTGRWSRRRRRGRPRRPSSRPRGIGRFPRCAVWAGPMSAACSVRKC
jgi:uncharacterized protein (DUF1800 family)